VNYFLTATAILAIGLLVILFRDAVDSWFDDDWRE